MAKRLFVGNLPYSYGANDLREIFGQYGEMVDATVVMDRETSSSKGFGFVEFARQEDAARAIDGSNGADCDGRPIIVNEAREKERPAGRGRHAGGRRAEGRGSGGYQER